MTKLQAYNLALQELPEDTNHLMLSNRAMEIFAGAFAEWVDNYWFKKNNVDGSFYWLNGDSANTKYTTAQLIAEFEKIDNK